VLDRQVIDVDGAEAVRVSDLVLDGAPDALRLVGADMSQRTLLRRLGPRRLRRRVARERVYDWANVAGFAALEPGTTGTALRLSSAAAQLHELRPGELEALLDDLGHPEGEALAPTLGPAS
jgi:hypothetical protein